VIGKMSCLQLSAACLACGDTSGRHVTTVGCREGEVVERNQMLIELQPVTGEDS